MATATSGCTVPVFFATTEGQTRRIAERLAAVLREAGLDSCAIDLGARDLSVDWARVRAAVVGASLHAGRHQAQATAFVRAHAAHLNRVPSVFFSVSLSAASQNLDEVTEAKRLADEFPRAHGWTPLVVRTIAGSLAYTKYGFWTRLIMKRIARKEGAPIDTSRDYELTNWDAVDRLGREVAALVASDKAPARRAAGG